MKKLELTNNKIDMLKIKEAWRYFISKISPFLYFKEESVYEQYLPTLNTIDFVESECKPASPVSKITFYYFGPRYPEIVRYYGIWSELGYFYVFGLISLLREDFGLFGVSYDCFTEYLVKNKFFAHQII